MEFGKVSFHFWERVFRLSGTHKGMAMAIIKHQKVPIMWQGEKMYFDPTIIFFVP